MSFAVQNNISREFINDYNIRTQKRRRMRQRQRAKFGFTLIMLLFFMMFIPKILWNTLDQLFIRGIINSKIKISKDSSLLNSTEKIFANDYFLDKEFVGDVEVNKPLMRKILLTQEMPILTYKLKNLAKQSPNLLPGIFIWDFSTGKYVNINADKEFPTASMIKIPVLFQLFRRTELGLINLNDRIMLEKAYISEGSGYLQYRPPGSTFAIYNLAQLMIQESDNTATNILLASVGGRNDLNRVMRSWGFSQTHLSDLLPDLYGTNVSTPKDLGTMLYNIDNPDFLTLENRAKIVEIMSHVRNRFLIQAGLPDSAQFIHKSGDIGTMLGDAGMVVLPDGRRYIIVVMVKRPWNSYSAKEFIIQASKITYESIASRNY